DHPTPWDAPISRMRAERAPGTFLYITPPQRDVLWIEAVDEDKFHEPGGVSRPTHGRRPCGRRGSEPLAEGDPPRRRGAGVVGGERTRPFGMGRASLLPAARLRERGYRPGGAG